MSVTLVLETIDETILNVALPTLQQELGASASGLQWMVNSYILVFGGLLLIMGGLGDRFGRARMLQAGLVVFGVASLAAAYVDTTGQLIAARAVMGAGAAMMFGCVPVRVLRVEAAATLGEVDPSRLAH